MPLFLFPLKLKKSQRRFKVSPQTWIPQPRKPLRRGRSLLASVGGRLPRALLLVAQIGAARAEIVGQLPIDFIGRAQGLPSSQVHAVAQGPDGSIWVAGPNGLTRMQGRLMRVWDKEQGLSTNGLRSLFVDRAGRVWVGSDLGADVVEADDSIRPLEGFRAVDYGLVEKFAQSEDGTVWIAAAGGLLSWREDRGLLEESHPALKNAFVFSVAATGDEIWAAVGPGGVLRRDPAGVWREVPPSVWGEIGDVLCLFATDQRTVLAGGEKGLVEISRDGGRVRGLAVGRQGFRVTAILESENELWLGVAGELRLYQASPGGWRETRRIPDTGLVHDLMEGNFGNVWVATDAAGLGKISVLRHAVVSLPQPCPGSVFSLEPSPRGDYWVGGENCSWRLRGTDMSVAERVPALDSIKVWDLIEDPEGTLWAATDQGLMEIPPGGEARFVAKNHPVLSSPGRVLLRRGGTLWVGTLTGLVRSSPSGVWETLAGASGESPGYVYSLALDGHGTLWVGTLGRGLWKETDDGIRQVVEAELSPRGNIYAIHFSSDGSGCLIEDDHLVMFREGRFRALPRLNRGGVGGSSVRLEEDGTVWIGGNDGLVHYQPATATVLTNLRGSAGLAGYEFNTSRSLLRVPQGLLCGLDRGLNLVDTSRLNQFLTPPRVRLGEFKWSKATLDDEAGVPTVQPGEWSLDLRFFAAWYVDEKGLTYRTRLGQGDWSETTTETYLHFNGLAPGYYSVRAAAFSPLTGWGPEAEIFRFAVASALWQRAWLWPLLLLAGAMVAHLAGTWRGRVLQRRAAELENLVSLRTEELREANETLSRMAVTDALTGIANFRRFEEFSQQVWRLAKRHGAPVSLVMIDVDRFKQFNDRYGHREGDRCLKIVASQVNALARRPGDLSARYGGEEFVLVLSETPGTAAEAMAEELRKSVEGLEIPHRGGIDGKLTISLGVASCVPSGDLELETLIRAADHALYQAKQAGRNRVVGRETPVV